jgi:hypothetical protein
MTARIVPSCNPPCHGRRRSYCLLLRGDAHYMPPVMRGIAPFVILVFLAGCSGGGPAPLPIGRISAYFPAGGVVDTIDIDAVDRLPLRSAELVAPDGRTTAASFVAAQPASSGNGVYAGGVAPLGTTTGQGLGPGTVGAGVQTQTTLLATSSNATIALPDPVAYRRDWRRYRIRLRFGAPPDLERREIAAPEPPAPATSPFPQPPAG